VYYHVIARNKIEMKTRNLIITLSVATLATMNIAATAAIFSPRAADNRPKIVPGVNNDPDLTATGMPAESPRLMDDQAKPAPTETKQAPAMTREHRVGTPKMMDQCTEHADGSMSCCSGSDAKTK